MNRVDHQYSGLLGTSCYHSLSRCVRRAFLCSRDARSGHCVEHRRQLIVDRLALLAGVFAIDIAAYVIMSNHPQLVLHVHEARRMAGRVILFTGPPLIVVTSLKRN